jgi:hypothetical protein
MSTAPIRPRAFDSDLRREAEKWIEDHPDVVAAFEQVALREAGKRRRFGMKMVAERVRWEFGYQFGNRYVAYIARHLVQKHPHIARWIRMAATGDELRAWELEDEANE